MADVQTGTGRVREFDQRIEFLRVAAGPGGMNLPVLLEAMTMREAMKGSELVALLEESAKAAVVNIKSFFEP